MDIAIQWKAVSVSFAVTMPRLHFSFARLKRRSTSTRSHSSIKLCFKSGCIPLFNFTPRNHCSLFYPSIVFIQVPSHRLAEIRYTYLSTFTFIHIIAPSASFFTLLSSFPCTYAMLYSPKQPRFERNSPEPSQSTG